MTSTSAVERIGELHDQHTSAKWRMYDPDVIPVWIAEMDYPLAPCIADALHDAVRRSDTGYRWPGALPDALTGFMNRHFAWTFTPEHVITLPDVLTGMAESIRRLTRPGESVVIDPPIYPPFFNVTRTIAQREYVQVPLIDDVLDLEGLGRAFARPEVSAYLMCHPHNPTGYVADKDTLLEVARLARRYNVTVISDEIWSPLTWTEETFTPYLSIDPDLTAPDVALVSASKAFNLAGLKCAQIVGGSPAATDRLRQAIPMETTYGTGHLGVTASIAAYQKGDEWLADTVATLQSRSHYLADSLARHGLDLGFRPSASTYLAWLDCRELGLGDDPAAEFLARGRVALNAGQAYGEVGRGFVRFNFATDEQVIEEAVQRMASIVAG